MVNVGADLQVANKKDAARLMVHHLELAAAYWECTNTSNAQRAIKALPEMWQTPATSFLEKLAAAYSEELT